MPFSQALTPQNLKSTPTPYRQKLPDSLKAVEIPNAAPRKQPAKKLQKPPKSTTQSNQNLKGRKVQSQPGSL